MLALLLIVMNERKLLRELAQHIKGQLYVDIASKFRIRRYSVMLNLHKETPDIKSLYLQVLCTHRLTIKELQKVFPRAFDLYRIPGSVLTYVEFRSYDAIKDALRHVHLHALPFLFSDGKTHNVMFGCRYAGQEEFQEYVKRLRQEQKSESYCEEQERMYMRMVEFAL